MPGSSPSINLLLGESRRGRTADVPRAIVALPAPPCFSPAWPEEQLAPRPTSGDTTHSPPNKGYTGASGTTGRFAQSRASDAVPKALSQTQLRTLHAR